MPDRRIPAFVNLSSGSGQAAHDALVETGGFTISPCEPNRLDEQIREAVDAGAGRIVVAGGDGTVALAASAIAGTETELGVVPGGTLNHFARDHGIPPDHTDAAETAASGRVETVDLGYVNGRAFLNTSSVGAYVIFVRTRERLERWFGYRLATLLAALRLFGRVRPFTVELEVEGRTRRYRSALVFVGIGERELQLPSIGKRTADGRRGLHVIVVRGGTWARLIAAGFMAAIHGATGIAQRRLADNYIVDSCRIILRRPLGRVAVDGELVQMRSPLEYRVARDVVRLVVPEAPEPE